MVLGGAEVGMAVENEELTSPLCIVFARHCLWLRSMFPLPIILSLNRANIKQEQE